MQVHAHKEALGLLSISWKEVRVPYPFACGVRIWDSPFTLEYPLTVGMKVVEAIGISSGTHL